jgi:hypothetical protein
MAAIQALFLADYGAENELRKPDDKSLQFPVLSLADLDCEFERRPLTRSDRPERRWTSLRDGVDGKVRHKLLPWGGGSASVADIAMGGRAAMQTACSSGVLIRRPVLLVYN